jgi:hypothetical protein
MSNKSLLAFLLLLVLGGAFWMWTLEGDGAPGEAVDPLTQQPEVADPRGTASSAATPTEVAAKPEASAEVSARQLVDAQPEAQPAVESDDDLMLTVVEHATGAQVAGAVVSVLRTGGSGPNATLSGLLMTGLENTLRLNPQNVIATAESNPGGIVRLPASAGSEVLVAQWQGQHGLNVLEWGYDMGTTIRVAPPTLFLGIPEGANVSASLNMSGPTPPSELPPQVSGVVGPNGLDLTLEMGAPSNQLIEFRAVNERGERLAGRALKGREMFRGVLGGGSTGTSKFQTDENGFVRYGSKALSSLAKGDGDYRMSLSFDVDGERWMPALITLKSAPRWPLNLGDLVFAPAAPIVAGVVQDQDGKPLSKIAVNAWPVDDTPGFFQRWIPATYTQADGSFAVYAHLEESELSVSAESETVGRSPQASVPVGTTDLVLTVVRDGSLLVALAPEQLQFASGIEVRIQPIAMDTPEVQFTPTHNGGYSSDGVWFWSEFDQGGQVLWSQVPAGLYRLQLHYGGAALAEWDNVRVEGGQQTSDPRLMELHLSDFFERLYLRVFDSEGQPLPDANVVLEGHREAQPLKDGELFVVSFPMQIIVSHAGYLSKLVTATAADLDVRLSPAATIELRFPAPIDDRADVTLDLAMIPTEIYGDDPYGDHAQWVRVAADVVKVPVIGLGKQSLLIKRRVATSDRVLSNQGTLQIAKLNLTADCDGQTYDLELTETERALYCKPP